MYCIGVFFLPQERAPKAGPCHLYYYIIISSKPSDIVTNTDNTKKLRYHIYEFFLLLRIHRKKEMMVKFLIVLIVTLTVMLILKKFPVSMLFDSVVDNVPGWVVPYCDTLGHEGGGRINVSQQVSYSNMFVHFDLI